MRKIFLVFVSLYLVLFGPVWLGGGKQVYGQSCQSVVVDEYECVPDGLGCTWVRSPAGAKPKTCDPDTCKSIEYVCSSDDAAVCTDTTPNCYIPANLCSQVECSGGGGGESCEPGYECKAEQTCSAQNTGPSCGQNKVCCKTTGGGPSCTLTLTPETASIVPDESTTFTAVPNPNFQSQGYGDDYVEFLNSNGSAVTLSPASDSNTPFNTQATGVAAGSSTITARYRLVGREAIYCTDQSTVTVEAAVTGTIRSRAMVVTSADTSCTAVRNSTTGLDATVHGFTAGSTSQPAPQTQTGATYVQFNNVVSGTYTLDPVPPSGYVLKRACWAALPAGTSGEGLSQTLTGGSTLTWDLGYTLGDAWVQTQGGDVYASGSLISLTPPGINPRKFNLDGTGGSPGIVTYGTTYDFATETGGNDPDGANLVSSENWLVNETYANINWYDTFYYRFGSPTTADYDCSSSPCTITQPASRATPYYVGGNMTTQGNWSVGDGQTLIFLVDGNLTVDGTVRLTGKGFVSFIVKGNITVTEDVGSPAGNTNPDLEGVWITGTNGTFATGTGNVGGKLRLVLQGSFIAGNFLLERDLGSDNPTGAAELFIYNPLLLITMPDTMKEIKVTWQEVAP